MTPNNRQVLQSRVVRAAEAKLEAKRFVSAIDVLLGMGVLSQENLLYWRMGRVPYLERVVRLNLKRLSCAMAMFRKWAAAKGLKPSETFYRRWGRGPKHALRFSKYGNPGIERHYRTHYVSPKLAEPTTERSSAAPLQFGSPARAFGDPE